MNDRNNNAVDRMILKELEKQLTDWNAFVKPGILSIFYLKDMTTTFFAKRNELRKRSNLSFDERLFMKAPNHVELRMPVAVKREQSRIKLYDPYGFIHVEVEEEPGYELREDIIYIMKMIKNFPMHPLRPVLEKDRNGVKLHLKPTSFSLKAEKEEESAFKYLKEVPAIIQTESAAIDIMTRLQNIYRLEQYYVERRDPVTIVVDAEEPFIVTYCENRCSLKIGLLIN